MKRFLALTLVLVLVLCFTPGIAAFGTEPSYACVSDGNNSQDFVKREKEANAPYLESPWKLILDYDAEGHKTAAAVTYITPISGETPYEYDPGYWLLGQMLGKLDGADVEHRYLELTAGNFSPVTVPALALYESAEAGDAVYSAVFRMPDYSAALSGEEYEGRVFPDDDIELVLHFPGGITIRVPGQDAFPGFSAIKLNIYGDRLTVDFVYGEKSVSDVEAYVELSGSGTPVWIDAEGNEVEAVYEYDEASGVYKLAVEPGLSLVFKA